MAIHTDSRYGTKAHPKGGPEEIPGHSQQGSPTGMIIAGGGTGGHLFPGIAIAEEFLRRNPTHRILFIGTERGLEKKILGGLGLPLRTVRMEGIKGRGPMRTAGAIAKIPGSLAASFRILREFRPDIVVGVGGYASGPAVLAARLMGVKTAIAEQNAVPGLTNRILGYFADRIFLAFSASRQWSPKSRTMVTGNPVRAAFLAERPDGGENHPVFTILVFGGSQGAQGINVVVTEALDSLLHLRDRLCFIHQTGERDLKTIADAYRKQGFTAEVSPFIMDMASVYQKADLLVCRAGATSLAEITACGKASILIPFPFAVNDHQTHNAEILSRAGAAEVIAEKDLNGPLLAALIERLYLHPEAVRKMATSAAKLGNPNAAKDIVDACLALLEHQRRTGRI
jgi:UDP-N-acetylglucosamine--N-acetylmuramyl-(pentapeptide) pyrophosphoryl-undecaprenol N-acetylglucosamine transferase